MNHTSGYSIQTELSVYRQWFRRDGFTLIETLIAMVILTFTIIAVSNTWSGNVMRVQKSRINSTTAILLQRKMTEIEITYQDKPHEVPEEEKGDFGARYPGYSWELKSKEFEMPDMTGALIAREGGADEMLLTMVRMVADYIKKSAKEVSVTVVYSGTKAKIKTPLRNTVTTYFVDYTKEVSIPGMGALPGAAPGGAPAAPTGTGGAAPPTAPSGT